MEIYFLGILPKAFGVAVRFSNERSKRMASPNNTMIIKVDLVKRGPVGGQRRCGW